VLEWFGIGLVWLGLKSIGLDELDCLNSMGGVDWIGLLWIGCFGLDWIALDWLLWIGLD
jgi:hypothetical protein